MLNVVVHATSEENASCESVMSVFDSRSAIKTRESPLRGPLILHPHQYIDMAGTVVFQFNLNIFRLAKTYVATKAFTIHDKATAKPSWYRRSSTLLALILFP